MLFTNYYMLHITYNKKKQVFKYSLYRNKLKVTLRVFIQFIIVKSHDNKKEIPNIGNITFQGYSTRKWIYWVKN